MTPTTPLVSIIMLTYNRANYIGEAITSILGQTYQNWELIILDDGSTDDTATVVAQFSDSRIRYQRDTVNKGLYARRHESLSHVTGEYVAILDSDDAWASDEKLATQVDYLNDHPDCAVVGTFITLIDEHGTVRGTNSYYTSDAEIRWKILVRNQFANSSVLMRTRHLKQTAGYRDFAPAEDYELFLQLGRVGKFANLPRYDLTYRIHGGSESKRKVHLAKQIRRAISLHKDAYPTYFTAVAKTYLIQILAFLKIR